MASIVGQFDPWNPYSHVPVRGTVSKEGDNISEWIVTVEDMKHFLDMQKQAV
jgi:hypothetical protein